MQSAVIAKKRAASEACADPADGWRYVNSYTDTDFPSTGIGSSGDTYIGNYVDLVAGTVTILSFKTPDTDPTENYMMTLHDSDGDLIASKALVSSGDESGWWDFTLDTPVCVAAGTYKVTVVSDEPYVKVLYESSNPNDGYMAATTYSNWPLATLTGEPESDYYAWGVRVYEE